MTDMLLFLHYLRDQITMKIDKEEGKRRDERYASNVVQLGITADLVETESRDQWFNTVDHYNEWCDKNSAKPYRVWNGGVYTTGTLFTKVLCELSHLGVE